MSDRMDTLIANIRDRCIHGSIIEAFEALAAEVDSVRVSSARKEAEAAQKEAEQAYVHLEAKVSGLEKARDEAERHESVAKHGRREAWHAASQLADGIRKALTYVTPGATDVAVRAALKEYETSGVQPKAVKAVRDIQEASAARGTDQITDAEIDAEIKAVRDARATTCADASDSADSEPFIVHVVCPGDTLSEIAQRFKVPPGAFTDAIDHLVCVNRLPSRDKIDAGWYLIVPTSEPYIRVGFVRAGRAFDLKAAVVEAMTYTPVSCLAHLRAAIEKFNTSP